MKIPFIICADIEPLLQKIDTYHSNPETSSTTKINKHTGSGYSLFWYCSFVDIKNNHDYYRGKNCMKRSAEDLKNEKNKEKNDTINKWRKIIIPRKKIFALDAKKNLGMIMKNTIKSNIIVITLQNIKQLLKTIAI